MKILPTQLSGYALQGAKNVIAIASGKGGVGKSTVTVNLAVSLAQLGFKIGVLDADIYGPSLPTLLGVSTPPECINDKYQPIQAHGIKAMSIGFLTPNGGALIWRGPMLAKSLIQMMNMTEWQDLDILFVDLPPGTGDIQLSLVQKIPLAGAIVVTTPQPLATIDAEKAIQMFEKTNIHCFGIIENMALHTCSHCQHQEAIFGIGGAQSLAEKYHIDVLGQLPLALTIREHSDTGMPAALSSDANIYMPFQLIAKKLINKF